MYLNEQITEKFSNIHGIGVSRLTSPAQYKTMGM